MFKFLIYLAIILNIVQHGTGETVTDEWVTGITGQPTASIEKCVYIEQLMFLNCYEINDLSEVTGNSATSTIAKLSIKPKNPIRFDSSLDLTGFETKLTDNYNILLQNLNSFNLLSNPFTNLRKKGNLLELDDLNFEFYSSNNQQLSAQCLFLTDLDFKPLFSSFDTLFLENVKFTDRVCPLVFQNAIIKRFLINSLSVDNNLIFTALIDGLNKTNNVSDLNSNIEALEVYRSGLRYLEKSLLNEYVFKNLKQFIYHSSTSSLAIQNNLFQNFQKLKEFSLFIPDLGSYLKRENFEWVLSLNSDVYINTDNITQLEDPSNKEKQFKLVMNDASEKYTFPNKDFCFFKDFPHYKSVFPIIKSAPNLECSCSLLRLTQFAAFYKDTEEIKTPSVRNCLSRPDFNDLVKNCDFKQRIAECDKCSFNPVSLFLNCTDVENFESLNTFLADAIKTLRVRSKNKIIFEGNLNFDGQESKFQENYDIYLENFNGFIFTYNPFLAIERKASVLRLKEGNFDFYLNGNQPLSSACIFSSSLDNRPLLSDFDIVRLESDVNTSVIQCPLIFQNANIKRFILNSQSEQNKLTFRPLLPTFPNSENDVSKLNSRIESFEIYNSELKYLDSSLLNRYIFKDMKSFTYVSLTSNVNLENTLFGSFKSLKEFKFFVPNLELYLRNQDLKWSLLLNSDVKVDLENEAELQSIENQQKQFKLNVIDSAGNYKFPEKDFCIFKDFPHDQLVFPIINTTPNLACTCSLLWVIQYSPYYKNQAEIQTPSVKECLNDANFQQMVDACNFEERINECNKCSFNETNSLLDCNNVQDLSGLNIFQADRVKKLRIRPRDKIIFDDKLNLEGNFKFFNYKPKNAQNGI